MAWLVVGVLLWSGVHLVKAVAPGPRARLVARMGERPWQALVALLLLVALGLMIAGYRAAAPGAAYRAPAWGDAAGSVVAVIAMILFVASARPTNLRRHLRHPQLLSVILWGVAHLLAGGDRRGLLLFGGLAVWAGLEMLAINRRDGAWRPPAAVPRRADALVLGAGIGLAVIAVAIHEWLGVRVVTG